MLDICSSVDVKVSQVARRVVSQFSIQWLVGSSVERITFEGQISLLSGSSARQSISRSL